MTYAKRMAAERDEAALEPYEEALDNLGATVKNGKVTLSATSLDYLVKSFMVSARREGEAAAEARLKDYSFEDKIKDVVRDLLRAELRIDADRGDFTMPNDRTVKLMLDDEEVSSTTIDVADKPEYEE